MKNLDKNQDMWLSRLHGHVNPEPISLEYIAAAIEYAGFKSIWRSYQELSIKSKRRPETISLFSAITSEYPQVIKSARLAKARGEITVLGGYHASGCRGDLLNDLFDYIVVGEGEEVAPAIVKANLEGERDALKLFDARDIGSSKVVIANRIKDIDSLPLPLRANNRLSQYRIYDLMWPPLSQQLNTALVLGSRGCKNDCDFCASSSVWGYGIRYRSPANVGHELLELKKKFGSNTVVFIDQSLGQAKQWAVELCTAIKNESIKINWYHQSNLTIDREVIRVMAEAGCTKIGFGIEGISSFAIEKIKVINPFDLDSINSLFDYCNKLGIFVKAYLMIGFPWETESIIEEYLEWIQKLRANQVKISFFTPFPGTRAWEQYSSQLLSRDWTNFDTVRLPVVYNPSISIKHYNSIREKLFKAFYGSATYADVTYSILKNFPQYTESYREFVDYLKKFEMISGDEIWLRWIYDRNKLYFPTSNR